MRVDAVVVVVAALVLMASGLSGCDDGGESVSDAAVDGAVASACGNGLDDDGDGLVDLDDPGCATADDDDESDAVAACANGVDDDGDGAVDLDDPGCEGADDDDEADPAVAACANGVDDDDDGAIDLADPGCEGRDDDDESDDPGLPACGNGIDDDGDGWTDFPADPGCGSARDDDEVDEVGPMRPQCSNGLDDDGDGRVDLSDPGCASVADPREADPEERPGCSNGLDDDNDGIVDFPLDPGCSAAGDDEEFDPDRPAACTNGEDDDRDGLVDYPNDPGCAGVGDSDEGDPPVPPACADGIDNDDDGAIDFPADRGCSSAADTAEGGACGRRHTAVEIEPGRVVRGDSRMGSIEAEGSCGGRGAPEVVLLHRVEQPIERLVVHTELPDNTLESVLYIRRGCVDALSELACVREATGDGVAANRLEVERPAPGEYYIFVDGAAGRGAQFAVVVEEVPLPQCENGIDDDGDGRVDYPNDPGCAEPLDRDEADPAVAPACADEVDNDGDGAIDYPQDTGCGFAGDDDEVDVCGQGVRVGVYPFGAASVLTDTRDAGDDAQPSCDVGGGPDRVFVYDNPYSAQLTISVDHPETVERTTVAVRAACDAVDSEVQCDAGEPPGLRGVVVVDRAPPGPLYIWVDHPFGLGGVVRLSIESERLPAGCVDGVDNDGDGFVDGDDPGCVGPADEDERDEGEAAACFDGEDNDGDGWADYPFDPGCVAKGDDDEADPDEAPACANGVDDDDDGLVDYPADAGCSAAGDDDEMNPRRAAACTNRLDDDMDGVIDFPNDPGCVAPGDLSERSDGSPTPCADGLDNDRDGIADFPFDPGCAGAGYFTEVDPVEPGQCGNGVDDDDDGAVDFPLDPGCAYAADTDEADPAFPPQCANGRDDDGNGRIDFPDDPGCRFAGDALEELDGDVSTRCSDGIDNDLDGLVDLRDPGCRDTRDDDETDAEVVPLCADGIDNDGDGLVDWPEEDGCLARGDACEQPGWRACGAGCQPVEDDPLNCGRCGRVCAPGVECSEGRCGALRPRVLLCGEGGERPVGEFIRGALAAAGVEGARGCNVEEDIQAVLIAPGGMAVYQANPALSRAALFEYLEGGGQLITSRQVSRALYALLFEVATPACVNRGSCEANVQPTFQMSAADPFWQENAFDSTPAAQTGCGCVLNAAYLDLVPLGGWSIGEVQLGYIDVGAGRLWLVEADWYDPAGPMNDASRDLMAAMIVGSGNGPAPPCFDGRDDDGDGLYDLDDPGCTGADDFEEGEAVGAPACANGLDDDGDGIVDFPWEPGCVAAGDDDEVDPPGERACSNGLDDDGDGEADYPYDRGCTGAGDNDETDPVRLAHCGNGRDDDGDGLVDYPADPGCRSRADAREGDPAAAPACANGLDDDRDGIVDWPFDPGCVDAADTDEAGPVPGCFNGVDDDGDGVVDFPADPGCGWAGDPREDDPLVLAACGNGADDDGDGEADWPADRGCRFAADESEVDPFRFTPRCVDGVDNDGDGIIDLADPGCVDRLDDDELDPDEAPVCDNGLDDDEDGLLDWPADPGCQAQGDVGEAQACAEPALELEANGVVMGVTAEGDPDRYRSRCGGREAPDAVYRYVLAERARLVVSADEEGTEYPVVLSVRRDCEEPLSELACAGDFRRPAPTVVIEDAEPGEYFVFVDGGGPERWVSDGGAIAMPPDPRNFVARDDFRANCGWSDGGSDAFDCYGRITVAHGGEVGEELDPTLGQPRAGGVGGYAFEWESELVDNVWRFTLRPEVEHDERPVTVTFDGNLGSDGATVSAVESVEFEGRPIDYLFTHDGRPGDPPVVTMFVPSDPEQLDRIEYMQNGQTPMITAREITLPLTIYVALSYAAGLDASEVVAGALVDDLMIEAGGGGPDAPRFGEYVLSVSEEAVGGGGE